MSTAAADCYPRWFVKLAEEWRARLIPEWKLTLQPDPPHNDPRDAGEAASRTNATYHTIRVWVDMTGHREKWDLEESLVHEILHAPVEVINEAFWPAMKELGAGERGAVVHAYEMANEQTIERLARALVALKYGEPQRLLREAPSHSN